MAKWNDAFLDRMRQQGDEFADHAVREIFKDHTHEEHEEQIHNIVKHPLNMRMLPPVLANYFETLDESVFTEEDTKAFDKAIEIFDEHGFRIFLLLFFKSLPTGYMAPKPGHVLATTQLLINQATRRVFETAIYIMSVMRKDWYKGEKHGLRMLEKLRFLHSSMRVQIQDERGWDTKTLGVPINQEDQVLTLQLFSLAVIRGLHEMGICLSRDERQAWFHTWRRIGRILGISEELEPKTIKEAWALQNKIYKRQFTMPNKDGKALTNALLAVMNKLSKDNVSMTALEKITRYFLYQTEGKTLNEIAESLGMDSKPSMREKIIGRIVYHLVNWGIWDWFFHRKEGASFGVKFIRRQIAHSLDLGHRHDDGDETEEVLDALVKEMLNELKSDAQAVHHNPFDIDDHLVKKWKLDGWDYSDPGDTI